MKFREAVKKTCQVRLVRLVRLAIRYSFFGPNIIMSCFFELLV